mmetsp:Transcript_8439/g.9538  ORF Transcript_8439/g.9538 Transcript_8439/m.9538 type:complete len:99 (-) Transcript_8439:304-600(-)
MSACSRRLTKTIEHINVTTHPPPKTQNSHHRLSGTTLQFPPAEIMAATVYRRYTVATKSVTNRRRCTIRENGKEKVIADNEWSSRNRKSSPTVTSSAT